MRRCFAREVHLREDWRAIIRAITSLAASLGMITTAEGVEEVAQLERLREEGCTEASGIWKRKIG
jgi:EAL domain-containing protein (putative c-di-GMP-specific phosphodiesterase class I)